MTKLSVLIFSKDNAQKALSLAEDLYEISDEIVVIDSSKPGQRAALFEGKKKRELEKLRIHYAIALGYADPLRMYGIKKCRGEWILLMDTDERITPEFKEDMRGIIKSAKCEGFAIKRYERVSKNVNSDAFTWQTRLFKKGRTLCRGMPHEQPIINGRLEMLPDKYAIKHLTELQNEEKGEEYEKMVRFERLSYRMYNDILAAYVYKLGVPRGKGGPSPAEGAIRALMGAYEKVTLRDPESEISQFDYFVFFYTRYTIIAAKLKAPMANILSMPRYARIRADAIKTLKGTEEGRIDFEVSKIINREGLIQFLGLDDERTVERLDKEYGGGKHGIGINLIFYLTHKAYLKRTHSKATASGK